MITQRDFIAAINRVLSGNRELVTRGFVDYYGPWDQGVVENYRSKGWIVEVRDGGSGFRYLRFRVAAR
jgi:hypothetical protein